MRALRGRGGEAYVGTQCPEIRGRGTVVGNFFGGEKKQLLKRRKNKKTCV